jgi:hypothetical protein
MVQKENGWSKPEIAPFSGIDTDYDPMLSYDGNRLFYCSNKPLKKCESKQDTDIWMVERENAGWSQPKHLGPIVNSEANEFYPCVTKNGALYFTSGRTGGLGSNDIYRCKLVNGKYTEPVNLGDAINSKSFEGDVFIAADEGFMIVTCYGRPDSLGSGDLYISFQQKDGSWSKLKNMGNPINSKANEHCPMVSHDNKFFFFTSYRITVTPDKQFSYADRLEMQVMPGNGNGDIFWMYATIIEQIKNK